MAVSNGHTSRTLAQPQELYIGGSYKPATNNATLPVLNPPSLACPWARAPALLRSFGLDLDLLFFRNFVQNSVFASSKIDPYSIDQSQLSPMNAITINAALTVIVLDMSLLLPFNKRLHRYKLRSNHIAYCYVPRVINLKAGRKKAGLT